MRKMQFYVIWFLLSSFSFRLFAADPSIAAPGRYNIDLGAIVITASKLEQSQKYSTQNISVISANDIESSGASDISEILDLLPSVDMLEYGSAGTTRSVRTRGAAATQVLTLIDGRPMNTPRDGITDFNRIPISNIDRIEVLRGPASNIYGANAVGGVINIITKSGKENTKTEVLTKFGSFATNLASLSHGNEIGNLDYFLSYEYLTSHGHRDNSDYLSNNVNTKIGYQLDNNNRISVSGGYSNAEVGDVGRIVFQDLDDKHESFSKFTDLTYNGRLAEDQDILAKIYYNSDRLEFVESYNPTDKSTHHSKLYGFESQVSQTFFDIFRTAIGADYKIYKLNSSESAKHSYSVKGAYVESELDVFDLEECFLNNGVLKVGARWDSYSNFGDKISPSASFNIWLFDVVKIHALVADSFRAPTFNDLYWPREDWGIFGGVEGNNNLTPENARSYEAGISTYLFNQFKTDLTFFKTSFDDLIEWEMDSTFWWRPQNVSSATIKGAEIETEFVLHENLKANLNYTYLEAKNKDTHKWLIYRPRHSYKLRVAYSPIEKYEFACNFVYKTKRFTNVDNTERLGHDWNVNLNASYQASKHLKFIFDVKNVFDREYEEQGGYPLPGRSFYGGLKITF